MKRISLPVIGYYLIFQAAIAALNIFGTPEHGALLTIFAGFSDWGGYKLIRIASGHARLSWNAPNIQRVLPKTR